MVEIIRPRGCHEEWIIESSWRANTGGCDEMFGVQPQAMVARGRCVEMRQLWENAGDHKGWNSIGLILPKSWIKNEKERDIDCLAPFWKVTFL